MVESAISHLPPWVGWVGMAIVIFLYYTAYSLISCWDKTQEPPKTTYRQEERYYDDWWNKLF